MFSPSSLVKPSINQGFARCKSQSAYPELWDGLVAHYDPGLGPTGPVLYDWAGRRLDGALTNMDPATDWVVTERGYALDFDGSNDEVDGPVINHNIGTGDFSWTLWLYRLATQTGYRGVMANGSFAPALYSRLSSGQWGMFWGSDRSAGETLALNQWYFLCAIRRSGTLELWRDGQKITEHAVATSMANAVLTLANSGPGAAGGSWSNCRLGAASIHSRALTPFEILLLAQGAGPLVLLPKRWAGFESSGGTPQTLTTDPAVVDWNAQDATLVPGAVTLSTTPAVVDWEAQDATLVPGAITLSTTPAVVDWTATDATIDQGSIVLPTTPAVVNWAATDATLVPGATTLSTTPAIVQWIATNATIPGGAQILETTPAIVTWVVRGATIELQSCPVLKGCRDNPFTYSIENPDPTPVGENCRVLSGCTDNPFSYSIE